MPSKMDVQITGRIGNLIFYKRGDQYCMRTSPKHIKQTAATKKRATEFGKASQAGGHLRRQLRPVIPFPSDIKMQTRLVSDVYKWMSSPFYKPGVSVDPVLFLNEFQFTECYPVTTRWRIPFVCTNPAAGLIQIKIPAFVPEVSLEAPAKTIYVECKIASGGCDIQKGLATGCAFTSFKIDYNKQEVPEQTISFSIPTNPGSLIVTGISLEYFLLKNGRIEKNKNIKFMPAGIVSAMYL